MTDAFTTGVTPQALCRCVGLVTDDSSSPEVYTGLFSAVRVRRVTLYYTAPQRLTSDTAATTPSFGGWSISIQPQVSTLGSVYQYGEVSDTSMTPDEMAVVTFVPDPLKYPAIAGFNSSATTDILFYVKGFIGAVVDIEMDLIVADGGFTQTNTTVIGHTSGTMGYGYLDDAVAAGSRGWCPVGATVHFN